MLPIALIASLAPGPGLAAPSGLYVEARTASVYAGACHYNGELVTDGREALLAWRIESGGYEGTDLAGVELAAVVVSDANLAAEGAERRAVIHVDAGLAPDVASAAVAWLARTRAEFLGTVIAVRSGALEVEVGAEGYRATAPGAFELRGAPMPDRACCRMPLNVWYRPFEHLDGRLVGLDERFEVREPALGASFSRPDENAAFVGRFGGS